MNSRLFEAFESRAQQVKEYMAGCGQKYGMGCTCGPGCRCANCSEHCKQNRDASVQNNGQQCHNNMQQNTMGGFPQDAFNGMMSGSGGLSGNNTMNGNSNIYGSDPMGGGINGFPNGGMGGNGMVQHNNNGRLSPLGGVEDELGMGMPQARVEMHMRDGGFGRRASRNPSIISFGGVRGMSVTSEATFGRAMSGLSALSIDWENLEDFDVNVDHSAHINNAGVNKKEGEIGEGESRGCRFLLLFLFSWCRRRRTIASHYFSSSSSSVAFSLIFARQNSLYFAQQFVVNMIHVHPLRVPIDLCIVCPTQHWPVGVRFSLLHSTK